MTEMVAPKSRSARVAELYLSSLMVWTCFISIGYAWISPLVGDYGRELYHVMLLSAGLFSFVGHYIRGVWVDFLPDQETLEQSTRRKVQLSGLLVRVIMLALAALEIYLALRHVHAGGWNGNLMARFICGAFLFLAATPIRARLQHYIAIPDHRTRLALLRDVALSLAMVAFLHFIG